MKTYVKFSIIPASFLSFPRKKGNRLPLTEEDKLDKKINLFLKGKFFIDESKERMVDLYLDKIQKEIGYFDSVPDWIKMGTIIWISQQQDDPQNEGSPEKVNKLIRYIFQ